MPGGVVSLGANFGILMDGSGRARAIAHQIVL